MRTLCYNCANNYEGSDNMAKTSNLYVRIEPTLKEQAEQILDALGVAPSSAINMFYKQIVMHRGLPFEVKIPQHVPLDMDAAAQDEIDQVLEQGYQDMIHGRTRPVEEVFADIRKDYNL